METTNLSRPGQPPVAGDYIRIVHDNGTVEELHYTPPPLDPAEAPPVAPGG